MAEQSLTLDPVDKSAHDPAAICFDLRFFLSQAEWKEAAQVLHPIVGNPRVKPFVRVFNGLVAIGMFLLPPKLFHQSWLELFKTTPPFAIFLALMALFCAWSATGIGVKSLDQHLNRLDLERHMVVTQEGLTVAMGERRYKHQWKDFVFYRETPSFLILRGTGVQFWTIPLRAIPPTDLPAFRDLIGHKLPRRQRWSWSPDSSKT
jgi:hypothetical protein